MCARSAIVIGSFSISTVTTAFCLACENFQNPSIPDWDHHGAVYLLLLLLLHIQAIRRIILLFLISRRCDRGYLGVLSDSPIRATWDVNNSGTSDRFGGVMQLCTTLMAMIRYIIDVDAYAVQRALVTT
jgi:hypothetical protein